MIHIIGDILIDEYYDVYECRESVEGGPQIMGDQPPHVFPGGAGNLARQFQNLPVEVSLSGLMDTHTRNVCRDLKAFSPISFAKNPIKKRFIHQGKQIFRWDHEQENYGLSKRMLENDKAKIIIRPSNLTILSDYGKGIFPLKQKITGPIIVDPKNHLHPEFHGCLVFKPNKKEALELSGKDKWEDQAKTFTQILQCENVVITRGRDGVCGMIGGELFEYDPKLNIQEVSVVGAGDAFLAHLSYHIHEGVPILEAVKKAYHAGATYVQGEYNEPV